MTSGVLTDLDPPPPPERRWPLYLAWLAGGLIVAAALLSHLPATPASPPGAPPRQVVPEEVEPVETYAASFQQAHRAAGACTPAAQRTERT